MQTQRDDAGVVGLADYIRMLKRRWWILVIVPLLAAAAAYRFSSPPVPVYQATATLLVSGGTFSGGDVRAANALAQTYIQLAASRPVLDLAISGLGPANWDLRLEDQVWATGSNNTPILYVHARDGDPATAARLANAVSRAFLQWLSQQQTTTSSASAEVLQRNIDQTQENIERTSNELDALRSRAGTPTADQESLIATLEGLLEQYWSTYGQLVQQQQEVELASLNADTPVTEIARAQPPPVVESGNRIVVRNTAAAFVFGLGMAAAGVVLLERTNVRIRVPHDVHRDFGLPTLATLPRWSRRRGIASLRAPHSSVAEEVRLLRTRLQFAVNGHGIGTIAVTSPGTREGKSLVAANLAVSFAQAGQQVVLVDGNLRRPRQHELFSTARGPGLSDLLADPKWQSDVLPPEDWNLVEGPVPGLQLLLAGSPARQPVDLLTSERLKRLVHSLRERAQVVVIDAPPLLAASEALNLAAAADHAVVVVGSERTRPGALSAAIANIKTTGVNLLGVVLTGVTGRRRVS